MPKAPTVELSATIHGWPVITRTFALCITTQTLASVPRVLRFSPLSQTLASILHHRILHLIEVGVAGQCDRGTNPWDKPFALAGVYLYAPDAAGAAGDERSDDGEDDKHEL